MCGISGFLWLGAGQPDADLTARLRTMISTLHHRGPDGEGVWTDGVCGLAHARLAIIDLTPDAAQPMSAGDGRYWITFNGEIYNFAELRAELTAKGYKFQNHSDTEVILNGYAEWGERVVDRLRGMFAFAVWDRAERRLWLARDRVGKKPLYWARVGDFLLFASEIKAILTWPGIERAPDLAALDQYFTLQYVPAPRTAFKSVRKLPQAHMMTVVSDPDRGGRIGEPVRYWQLPAPRAANNRTRSADLERELVERLREAVKYRLVSDVPVGAFLSGGVDSSAVVAMMAGLVPEPVKTFSIGFANEEYDETRYARMVAERYGTDHEEFIVEPDAAAVLPRLVWHYGEPFADPSMVPTYYVSEIARRKVTVALNGDGGDEAFLGYGRYSTCRSISRFDHIPAGWRKPLHRAITRLPAKVHRAFRGRLNRAADLLTDAMNAPSQRYAFTIAYFMDYMKREGYGDAMTPFLGESALDLLEPYFAESPSLVTGANWADIHTYLPDDLMVKVDVASMAHGLESRSPLLDHTLLEWAASIPEDIKMAGGVTKSIFKRAMEPYLPRDLLYRPKMGFGCPIDHWLRGELKEMACDTLLSRVALTRGMFTRDYVQRLLDEHLAGTHQHHTRLWALLVLELWFRMWIDEPVAQALVRPAA